MGEDIVKHAPVRRRIRVSHDSVTRLPIERDWLPMIFGSELKWRSHARWLITTEREPGRSSSGENVRPSCGAVWKTRKKRLDTRAESIRSGLARFARPDSC